MQSIDEFVRGGMPARQYWGVETVTAGSVNALRAWWLRRMIETPHPLLEKMTLFWHGHFATNGGAVHP